MMKHTVIRSAILDALRAAITQNVTFFDGRPAAVNAQSLPAIAVYFSDAALAENYLDSELWQATLHIELFLQENSPDATLDSWMEEQIFPALKSASVLEERTETFSAQGYEYLRDEEERTWRSADLNYSITYYL